MNRPVTLIEPGTVKLERLLPGPVERVWAYITESDKRAKWLAAGEFDLRVGGKIRLEFDNDSLSRDKAARPKEVERKMNAFDGVITRLEPMRVLAHTWAWNGGDTEVTYELSPRGKDVLLTIVHRRVLGKELVPAVMGGWDVHSGILADILNGAEPRPFWTTHSKLEREYAAAL
ncbi:MAG TPA: SRPBCC family protein [Burkholderiales bacterium]|nr:SRPBCC family protein [Burkholderiales bacterium]